MITKPTTYTKEVVLEELNKLLKELIEDEKIIYLGQLFNDKIYPRQAFSEWAKKYKDVVEISDIIKKIRDIIESRVVNGAMTNKLNATFSIFYMKNKYGWHDNNQNNAQLQGITININQLTEAMETHKIDSIDVTDEQKRLA